MTIARRLWLGFGALILLFALACLVIFFSERSIGRALAETVRVEARTRAAAYEMEINAVEIGRDVQKYRETGDERYLDRFENDRAGFRRFKASYDDLADTRRGRDLGRDISAAGRLDLEVLAGLRERGDPGLITEMAGMFVRDAPERLEELKRAVEAGDAGTAKRAAHNLKGSAGNMGAGGMARISADLQDAGAGNDLARAGDLADELAGEFELQAATGEAP